MEEVMMGTEDVNRAVLMTCRACCFFFFRAASPNIFRAGKCQMFLRKLDHASLSGAQNLASGVIHYASICSAVIPSERRPVLTRFGHALELDGAEHFTFHCMVRGMKRGEGLELKRIELSVTDYITLGFRM